jgi:hypothetical protein
MRVLCFLLIAVLSNFPLRLVAQNNTQNFGDSIFISNGLMGKVYLLPDTTRRLPEFDTMQSVSTIYTKALDIPPRSWTSGFPGIPDRFEWFGIEYSGAFKPVKTGKYFFKLVSDDGSKLYIDGKLIIDNDGAHGASSKKGEIFLDDSRHSIKIDYFQGPRFQIALQLFSNIENSTEEIFPGNNFMLYTPKEKSKRLVWVAVFSGIILIIIFFLLWKRKKKKN